MSTGPNGGSALPLPTPESLPPWRRLEIAGVGWRYTLTGEGGGALLVLPGTLGGADVSLRLMPYVGATYRILTVEYPPLASLAALLDGIEAILDHEGFERVDVLGGSYGGMVAQMLARRVPGRVCSLVLAGTAPPDHRRAETNARALKVVRFLPMAFVRLVFRLLIRVLLRPMPRPERRAWIAYFSREIRAFTKRDLVSRYRLAIEYDRDARFEPGDLGDVPVLILEGGDDRLAGRASRDALRTLYPGARTHVFAGVGHGAPLLRPEEWATAIRDFLRDSEGSRTKRP